VVVDADGRPIGWIPTQVGARGLEIPRRDPSVILASAASDYADYRYHESVTGVHDDGSGIEVTFDRGDRRRFDLVVGADGLHSRVRRLVFGPEERFTTHLGMYIATTDLHRPAADLRTVFMHNSPGRAVAIHPTTGREGGAFIFRHPLLPADVARDPQRQQQLLTDVYAGLGGACRNCSNGSGRAMTSTSIRSAACALMPGPAAARSWSVTPQAASRCWVRARAWPLSERRRSRRPSPLIRTI
jgi:2-polyprenyl-6-methoxyphenol hydroxylase-like FAD-dependent oxidoreductase